MAPSSAAKVTKDGEGLNLRPKKTSSKAPRPQLVCGGSRQINPNDEGNVKDVKMAVKKFNKKNNRNLRFVSIISGTRGLCAGYSYNIVIAATEGDNDDADPKNYHVDCWSRPWFKDNDRRRLIIKSFKEVQNIT